MRLRSTTREETAGMEGLSSPPFDLLGTAMTVSELTGQIRSMLEQSFDSVVVKGEVSGWTQASSGHRYFTIKDDSAALSCVSWKSRAVDPTIRNGVDVVVIGSITLYPPRGTYQLDCREIIPLGKGSLQIAFERLKNRLAAEGLFASERKRTIPTFPRRIGCPCSCFIFWISNAVLRFSGVINPSCCR